MPSDLQVSNIRDLTNANSAISIASDGQVTIAQNNPTIQLGSNATFPNGMIVNSGFKFHTSGNHSSNVSTGEAVFSYNQISCSIGNTINFGCNFRADTGATVSTTARYGKVYLYQSTASVSEGATSSLGTQLNEYLVGRSLTTASSVSADTIVNVNIVGGFVATATTHYLGLVFNGISASTDINIYMSSTIPLYFYYYESKGDVLT